MLEEINPLPCAELESAICHRDRLARAGQGHLQMTRGIIGSFRRMDETWMILGNEILKVAVQIGSRRGIGILVDHKTRAGVPDKDRAEAGRNPARAEKRLHLRGDLVGPLPPCRHLKTLGNGFHELINEGYGYPQSSIRPSAGVPR